MAAETAQFTRDLPVRKEFRTVLDDASYQPAPADWLIAVSDVVGSRKAIANGQYKAVNVAGVAIISALMNALETQDLPFIFGGDGAAVICAPSDRAVVAETMAKTVAWVKDDLGLVLRAALVPVSVVRAQGYDVLVQATQVSEAVNNYAFRGGGISRAEALMKAGEFAVPPALARQQARPDRIVVPLVADKAGGREHRLDHHRSRGERRRAVSGKGGKAARSRRHADAAIRLADAEGGPFRNLAAGWPRYRSEGDARRGTAFHAEGVALPEDLHRLAHFCDRYPSCRFRPETLQGIYISQHGL